VIRCRRLISSWSNINSTFVILLFTISIVAFVSSLTGSFALQYSNYTSQKLLVQFQYPLTWEIVENESIEPFSTIHITDRSSEDGGDADMAIYSQVLSDQQASNISDTGIRVMTELRLQALENTSSFEYNVIKYPSYLTIDGHEAGTFLYLMRNKMNGFLELYTAQIWNLWVGDHFYRIGFLSKADFFSSANYIEIRDKFINSIKFLGPDNFSVTNSTNLG